MEKNTFSVLIDGEDMAKYVAGLLVEMSTPFTVVPLPEDAWEFGVMMDVFKPVTAKLGFHKVPYLICQEVRA